MPGVLPNLQKFFRPDGRTMILPIDHGTAIPVPGLEYPDKLISAVQPYYDAFVVNYGIARACAAELQGSAICLRTDVYKPAVAGNRDYGTFQVYGAPEAERLGAHGVMNMLYPHHAEEDRITTEAAVLIAECHRANLPVILEALPFGLGRTADYTPENISFAVRAAAELGADVVKTAYPGNREAFRKICQSCPVPVIILGGAAGGRPEDVLGTVEEAIGAGAAGVAIGRNVWQAADPVKMAKALFAIVHENESAVAASRLLA